jgi:anti-sigma factor RsiW
VAYAYSVDVLHRVVRVQISGEFTRDDLVALSRDLARDPRVSVEFAQLVDLSAVTTAPDVPTQSIRQQAVTARTRVSRRAFVAPQPAIFGTCRMFASFRQMADHAEPVGVFRTMPEAEAWLGLMPRDS